VGVGGSSASSGGCWGDWERAWSVVSKEKTRNKRKPHTFAGRVCPHSPLCLFFVTIPGSHVGVGLAAASALRGCGGISWGVLWAFGVWRLAFGVWRWSVDGHVMFVDAFP
jgi:hypothetical protein